MENPSFGPDIMPLFPLPLVLFPGEVLPLHIFEPRYRQMIGECLEKDSPFGLPTLLGRKLQRHATEAKVQEIVKRYPDGRLDIRIQGIGVLDCLDFYPEVIGKLYPGGPVRRIDMEYEGNLLQWEQIEEAVSLLWRLLGIDKTIPEPTGYGRTFSIGHLLGLDLEKEYAMLCLAEESEREDFLLAHLQSVLPAAQAMEELRQKARMNGHFRHFPPQDWDMRD